MSDSLMELQLRESHFSGGNFAYIEQLYETYLIDPNAVPENWRQEFDKLPRVPEVVAGDIPLAPIRQHFLLLGKIGWHVGHPADTYMTRLLCS